MIPRDTLLAILADHCPAASSSLAIPYNARELNHAIAKATTDTGYAHGYAAATGDPWDYDASEVAHAIAEWENVALAREYSRHYAKGFAQGEADRNARRARLDAMHAAAAAAIRP